MCLIELCGPSRFSHWVDGEPVGKAHPQAWVQVAAVSREQTKNTMSLIQSLITDHLTSTYNVDVGRELIRTNGFKGRLEAVTSSYRSLEGNRPTFVLLNEALALDTPIPTPSGWTTMGDLRDGDTIYGSDGKATTVTKAHEVQVGRDSYRVTFDDGNSIVASDGHWWKVRVNNNRASTLHQMTTEQMLNHDGDLFLPESFDSLETEGADLPLDPYFLGLWLGDGASRCSLIATDERDAEELLGYMQEIEPNAHMRDANHIAMSQTSTRKPGSVQERLRKMGLIENKHIPSTYLRASHEQRLALLQGLMDADGSVRRGGHARFANTDQALLRQVEELLVSLGYHVKRAKFQTRTGERAHWAPLGQISFKAIESVNPFRLSRKAGKVSGEASATRTRLRRIVDIEKVESVPVRCISVSAEDKLFLAGRGMHATRNTHHWISGNGGHDMYDTIDGNATKVKARYLAITNAYLPGEDSVAERMRIHYDKIAEGRAADIRFLYDSIEAHPKTGLDPDSLRWAVPLIRGDAHWLDVEDVINSVLNGTIAPTRSRRMWLNQIVAEEDSLYDLATWAPLAKTEALQKGDEIVMGFDGGKTDDATALVAIRLSDSMIVPLGIWEKPEGEAGKGWEINRAAVDSRVRWAMGNFRVRGFYCDVALWESYIIDWTEDYGDGMECRATQDKPLWWDMRASGERSTRAHERLVQSVFDKKVSWSTERHVTRSETDLSKTLQRHVLNVNQHVNKYGMSFRKGANHRKIDAYAALMLAHEALIDYRTGKRKVTKKVRPGRGYFL